jgi:hypothetical protein
VQLHRRIDLETATMAIPQREKIRVEEEAKAKAAAEAAEAAALKGPRRNAHFNVGLDHALAGGSDALAAFLQSSPEEHMARAPDGCAGTPAATHRKGSDGLHHAIRPSSRKAFPRVRNEIPQTFGRSLPSRRRFFLHLHHPRSDIRCRKSLRAQSLEPFGQSQPAPHKRERSFWTSHFARTTIDAC